MGDKKEVNHGCQGNGSIVEATGSKMKNYVTMRSVTKKDVWKHHFGLLRQVYTDSKCKLVTIR